MNFSEWIEALTRSCAMLGFSVIGLETAAIIEGLETSISGDAIARFKAARA